MLQTKILWAAGSDLPPGWPILSHSHEFYHLMYICSGKAMFILDGIPYQASKGDCVMIAPHVTHEVPADSHSLLDVYELKFTISDSSIETLLKQAGPVIHDDTTNMEQTLQHIIHNWAANTTPEQEMAETLLASLILTIQMTLSVIPEQVSTYIDTSAYTDLTKKIIQYVENTHTESFSLDELETALGYNKRYLCSVFKENTGITIVEYLHHVRVRHATRCFYYHDVPVSITAQCVGFTTSLHFTRVFKQLVGITPSQFREHYSLNKHDISERDRLATPYLSVYEEILGVKRLHLNESINALRQLGCLY